MNRFVIRHTALTWLFSLLCVIALFVDGSNLTDLFSSAATIHIDEGDSFQAFDGMVQMDANFILTLSGASHAGDCAKANSASPRHLLLDQDSPSLQAAPLVTTSTVGTVPQVEQPLHHRTAAADGLFLQNCTLLI